MFCKKCGSRIEEGSKFCGICGTQVTDESQGDLNIGSVIDDGNVGLSQNSDSNVISNLESSDTFSSSNSVPELDLGNFVPVSDNSISGAGNVSSLNNDSNEKKKNFVPFVVGIIALLLIAFGIYFYFNNNNRAVNSVINNMFDKLEGLVFDGDSNTEKQNFLVNGDLSISTNVSGLEDLSSEKFNYVFGIDYPNKRAKFGVSLEEEGSEIVNILMYLLDNKSYISLGDVFDKLIISNSDFSELFKSNNFSNLSDEDVKYVLNSYNEIFVNSFDGEKFDKSKATITLDGKDVKVTKMSYNLTSKKLSMLFSNIIDGTLNDSKLLDIWAKAYSSNVEDIKHDLESVRDLYSDDSDAEDIIFNVYTKGFSNTFVGMDITSAGENIQIRNNSNDLTVEFIDGSDKFSFVVKKTEDSSLSIDVNSDIDGESIKGSISMSMKEVSSNNYDGTLVIDLSVDGESFKITSNFKETIGVSIDDINVEGAVNFDDITSEEYNSIFDKLEEKIMNSNLYDIFIGNYINDSSYIYSRL